MSVRSVSLNWRANRQRFRMYSAVLPVLITAAVLTLQPTCAQKDQQSATTSTGAAGQTSSAAPAATAVVKPKPILYPLVGRLEEVGGKGSRLPVGLTMKGLKALSGQIDPSVIKPKPVGISYPQAWTGIWGGNLRADQLYSASGDIASDFGFHQGESGVVVFSFLPQSSKIECVPTDIFFSKRDMPADSITWTAEQMEELKRQGKPKATFQGAPMLLLRCNLALQRLNGTQEKSVSLLNTAKLLRPGVIEQNVVVGMRSTDPVTKVAVDKFSEVVIRLTSEPKRPDLLLCQLAEVDYDEKGLKQRSSYLQGWLSPNWKSCATEIERRTGWSVSKLGYNELCTAMGELPGMQK